MKRFSLGRKWPRPHRLTFDPASLQGRLTAGIALAVASAFAGTTLWTSWNVQNLLVTTHKQNVKHIALEFPDRVENRGSVQSAIDNFQGDDILLWVKRNDGETIAQSPAFQYFRDRTIDALMSVPQGWMRPRVRNIDGRYYVVCSSPLVVREMNLGQLYVVQDITETQTMFFAIVRGIWIVSLLAIALLVAAIGWYVRRSLRPLRQLGQLAETISADDLGSARPIVERAPSEVRQLSQTFDTMLSRLSDAWEQQRQFVGNVSHELRTPLTLVSGYLQSLRRRSDNLNDLQREALQIAASQTDSTIRLLQDLLDLARADDGYGYFRLEPVCLNELVGEVVEMTERHSDRTIVFTASENPIEARADRDRLRQVLANLIDNAIKYSAEKPVTVALERRGTYALIRVSDRGYGIPLAKQARIFDRFYRCDDDRSRTTGGSGLGLSLVKVFTEGMGGTVTVRSTVGEGSTFTVTLPMFEV